MVNILLVNNSQEDDDEDEAVEHRYCAPHTHTSIALSTELMRSFSYRDREDDGNCSAEVTGES